MTTKNISPASTPVTYILLQTSSEAPKSTISSKTNKSKAQDPVRNISKQLPENCGYYLSEPKNFYCLNLCLLATGKLLAAEPQIYVPIPKATETYIPEDPTARLQLTDQTCGFRKHINPARGPPRNAPTMSVMKTPSADALKVPSISVMKTPSADSMKVPSASVMKTPSVDSMKVPSVTTMKTPSAVSMKVPSVTIKETPSVDTMKVPSVTIMKTPSADALKVPTASILKTPSADVMKVSSSAIVKASSSVVSKQSSAGAMKPRTKTQPKNQKKQDKEKHCLCLDLVLVNPSPSAPGIQHFPIPEATEVTISGAHVIC
ncbi:uncharacterized protein LOC130879916 [Chionomys nivalis]|uniref:uncharacterized protein LOC130879916 n=1 Tax=Chionomys nivalis TaxID=269649 RepID=UPI0025981BC3|nr:uncharacterized protein LOC130879916 [Chionomys nivalis]